MMIEGNDVHEAVEKLTGQSWLHGFWREEHNTTDSRDPGMGARAHQYLERMSNLRWMVIEDWDKWRFQSEQSR